MERGVDTEQLVEVAFICGCGALFYTCSVLLTLTGRYTCNPRPTMTIAICYFLSSVVFCAWFSSTWKKDPTDAFAYMFWKTSLAACFAATKTNVIYTAGIGIRFGRTLAYVSAALQIICLVVGFVSWVVVSHSRSEAVWAFYAIPYLCLGIIPCTMIWRRLRGHLGPNVTKFQGIEEYWLLGGTLVATATGSFTMGVVSLHRPIPYHYGIQCGFSLIWDIAGLKNGFKSARPKDITSVVGQSQEHLIGYISAVLYFNRQ